MRSDAADLREVEHQRSKAPGLTEQCVLCSQTCRNPRETDRPFPEPALFVVNPQVPGPDSTSEPLFVRNLVYTLNRQHCPDATNAVPCTCWC